MWESEEKFQAFGEKLMPVPDKAGIAPAMPTVFPLHNFVKD